MLVGIAADCDFVPAAEGGIPPYKTHRRHEGRLLYRECRSCSRDTGNIRSRKAFDVLASAVGVSLYLFVDWVRSAKAEYTVPYRLGTLAMLRLILLRTFSGETLLRGLVTLIITKNFKAAGCFHMAGEDRCLEREGKGMHRGGHLSLLLARRSKHVSITKKSPTWRSIVTACMAVWVAGAHLKQRITPFAARTPKAQDTRKSCRN